MASSKSKWQAEYDFKSEGPQGNGDNANFTRLRIQFNRKLWIEWEDRLSVGEISRPLAFYEIFKSNLVESCTKLNNSVKQASLGTFHRGPQSFWLWTLRQTQRLRLWIKYNSIVNGSWSLP
jgi:hypothetical protein